MNKIERLRITEIELDSYSYEMMKPIASQNCNVKEDIMWSDDDTMIHRLLLSCVEWGTGKGFIGAHRKVGIQDFIRLSELSNSDYAKMLASDLQYDGIPSINLQRVYRQVFDRTSWNRSAFHSNLFIPIEKTDGFWFLHNGEWDCIPKGEK